jgi:AMP-polyphosphate phosphotransferase
MRLDLVATVPTAVWGHDDLKAGEMWNPNSVIAWLIATAGLSTELLRPPPRGRGPVRGSRGGPTQRRSRARTHQGLGGRRGALVWALVGRLGVLDLSLSLDKAEEANRLEAGQRRLLALRLALGGKLDGRSDRLGPPVCVMFEGWDASGKGGVIRRLVAPLDPRHVRVAQFAAPTPDEKRHHFLWRFFPPLPGWGGMAVFDRSWYGRVLVERVEGLASVEQWERAYEEIVQFEKSLCLEGMILVKFWLHISAEEQLARFKRREQDPLKRWKLTDEDWRNRELRPAYLRAAEDMFERTDHELARWQLVEAESKRYARVKVLETVIREIEVGMRKRGFEPPAI